LAGKWRELIDWKRLRFAKTRYFSALIGTMIAYLCGNLTYKSPSMVYMEVNGVGYEVQISLNTYTHVQKMEKGKLFIYQQFKEDGQTLYGFFEQSEKNMFIQLIGINGVGAATARMMLSSMKPDEISRAISQGDSRTLERVKGIGKKTAERIVLELKDKMLKTDLENSNSSFIYNTLEQDSLNALVALGIPRTAAETAVKKAVAAIPEPQNLELIIKKALQFI
jgi:Holliday junction DNA helicase RuvA